MRIHGIDSPVAQLLAHRLQHRRVGPDLRVAVHAGLGRAEYRHTLDFSTDVWQYWHWIPRPSTW